MNTPAVEPSAAALRRRRWSFRVAALLLGLLPFMLVEGLLRALDFPRRPPIHDPLVDLHLLRPLFVPAADPTVLEIPPERHHWFNQARILRQKPSGQRRVFVLGGSTVQGEPYYAPSAFPRWLEVSLRATEGEEAWEVINCGGISYASYRVGMLLQEVLNYQPDAIIVYCGHNEFLEDREYASWRSVPLPVARTLAGLGNLHTVQMLRGLLPDANRASTRPALAREVVARLDQPGGLERYTRDPVWRQQVLEHYQLSMRQMVERCQQANVPLILCIPVGDDLQTPPFKFSIDPRLTPARQASFSEAWSAALAAQSSQEREQYLRTSLAIDPDHAGAAYALGRLLYDRGETKEATRWLRQARDTDVCPLRMLSAQESFLHQLAEEASRPVCDVPQLFSQQQGEALPGRDLLIDHVHPTILGHQLIAARLLEVFHQLDLLTIKVVNHQAVAAAIAAQQATLDEAYYQRAQQRLAGLRLWTQGRAKRLPVGPGNNPPSSAKHD